MKIKKLITLAAMAVMTGNVWGQTDDNLLKGWDGTGCTTENPNPKPSDFGWSSNKTVTWGTQDGEGSTERFVTIYDSNYKKWDNSKYTYNQDSELSSKLLYLHFSSDQTYTYTFKGLQPGHAYRFTGLVACHNDGSNGKCNVSIASANKTYINIYTDAPPKMKLYPMQAIFIVPATETAEDFKMVIANGNSSMLSISAIGLYDLGVGEVTYPAYNKVTNLDFNSSVPLGDGVSTYILNYNGDKIKKAQMQPVEGWYSNDRTGDCTAGGVMAYGSGTWVGSEANKIPSTNPNGEGGNALAVEAVWTGSVNYIRPVTFSAGTYSLSIPVYNQHGTTAFEKNLIGFVDLEGNEHYAETKKYPVGQWTTETIYLKFDTETKGYLSIGYTASNVGNDKVQHLFVDGITIRDLDLEAAKAELQRLILAFKVPNTNVGNDAFKYPKEEIQAIEAVLATAQGVCETATTKEAVMEQIDIVKALDLPALNGPAENTRYSITNVSVSFKYANNAMTMINDRTDAGYYNIRYFANVNSNYAQAFEFTPVPDTKDTYYLSQTDKDGQTRYVCLGSKYGGYEEQIRTTTTETDAAEFCVIPMDKENNWKIRNVEVGKYLGSSNENDNGVYSTDGWYRMIIAPAVQAQATLKVVTGVKYGTFIAPFKAEKPENVTLYSVDGVDGTTLKLVEAEEIAANTPYIVYADAEETISETLKAYGTAYKDSYEDRLLVGTLAGGEKKIGTGYYLLQKQNDVVGFYKCKDNTNYKLGANRAYLKYEASAGVKAFFFGDENNETAITALSDLMSGKAEIYDLNGRKLQKLEKGVNIVNGKKVIIK